MKIVTLEGEYYARSTVGKGYDSEFFKVECVYPYDLTMDEDVAERKKRQRAFMFMRNFNVEDLVKEDLKLEKKLKHYGGSIRTAAITDVEDITATELKKPKYKKLRESISHTKNGKQVIIKPHELTYDDVMKLSTQQIVFCFMSITDPAKEDSTQLVSRKLHDLKKGAVEKKREILAKYLKLEKVEEAEIHQEMTISDDDLFEGEAVKPATKKNAVKLDDDIDLDAAAGA